MLVGGDAVQYVLRVREGFDVMTLARGDVTGRVKLYHFGAG